LGGLLLDSLAGCYGSLPALLASSSFAKVAFSTP
jgi:hypothetical protein